MQHIHFSFLIKFITITINIYTFIHAFSYSRVGLMWPAGPTSFCRAQEERKKFEGRKDPVGRNEGECRKEERNKLEEMKDYVRGNDG